MAKIKTKDEFLASTSVKALLELGHKLFKRVIKGDVHYSLFLGDNQIKEARKAGWLPDGPNAPDGVKKNSEKDKELAKAKKERIVAIEEAQLATKETDYLREENATAIAAKEAAEALAKQKADENENLRKQLDALKAAQAAEKVEATTPIPPVITPVVPVAPKATPPVQKGKGKTTTKVQTPKKVS